MVKSIKTEDDIKEIIRLIPANEKSIKNGVRFEIIQLLKKMGTDLIYKPADFDAYWDDLRRRDKRKEKDLTKEIEKKNTKKAIKIRIRDDIRNDFSIVTKRKPKFMYVYEEGVYRSDYITYIEQEIQEHIDSYEQLDFGGRLKKDIILSIQIKTYLERNMEFDGDLNIINFKNGFYLRDKRELIPHTPKYLSSIQIPINYNPESKDKDIEITQFLKETLLPKDISTFYEFGGLCLIKDISFQKELLFYGSPKTKKTTIKNLINKIVGVDNVSHLSLNDLNDKYKIAKIENKLVNSASDIDYGTKIDVNVFKRHSGGDDKLLVEDKFIPAYDIEPTARNIFTCANDFPYLSKYGNLDFFRRWVWLPCPYVVEHDKIDMEKLRWNHISDEELEGLLLKFIEGLERLVKRGAFEARFYEAENLRQLWTLRSSELFKFVAKCAKEGIYKPANIDKDNKFWEDRDVVLKIFNKWMVNDGKSAIGETGLTKLFNSHPTYKATNRVIKGIKYKIYTGFTFGDTEESKPERSGKGSKIPKKSKKKPESKKEPEESKEEPEYEEDKPLDF